ncbi:hypothetical protein GIB67_000767, partial [Kingdonia uniflora]
MQDFHVLKQKKLKNQWDYMKKQCDDHSSEVLRVLKDMVSSYEIDNTLFFKSLKFLGGSNEHIYRMMFLGLDPEQR